eukprot:GFYU01028234.1.p1 GENE.GFYU01028234.1~~GFYU01028234.1.p1  ORF type:complete len:361 (-),score=130.18 GFYU01028234.1:221-1303(-)
MSLSAEEVAFRTRVQSIGEAAASNYLISVGGEVGLLEALCTFDEPKTSQEIAAKAGLNERYTREWLKAMFYNDLMELTEGTADPENKYFLPKYQRAAYTGNTSVIFMNRMMCHVGTVFDDLNERFKTGEGIPYSAYRNFHSMMDAASMFTHSTHLLKDYVPSIPGLKEALDKGAQFCDIGCGHGSALMLLAEAFPNSTFLGIDFNGPAIERATAVAAKKGLKNLTFLEHDASKLTANNDLKEKFDFVATFDAIHDQSHPGKALEGIRHILKAGGTYVMSDIRASSKCSENRTNEMAKTLSFTSLFHCMPVAMLDNGDGLGNMWGHQLAKKYVEDAGLTLKTILDEKWDKFNYFYICEKSA